MPCNSSAMTTSDWIRLAAAVGTWAAVVVALFGEFARRWLKRPQLGVQVENESPRCVMSSVDGPHGRLGSVYYLRLWIENHGDTPAEQVEVVATALWMRRADGTFQTVTAFHPMNLVWAYLGGVFTPRISPGMGRHCDLGRVADPAIRNQLGPNTNLASVASHAPILDLAVEVRPNSLPHLLAPGVYRLEVRVAGANVNPIAQVIEITLTDRWYPTDDEMRNHGIRISPARIPRIG